MNRLKSVTRPLMWFMALLLAAMVTGCGGGGGSGGSAAKAMTAYSLAGATGTINETAKTIAVTMPYGTNVTALIATFTTTGVNVKVGAVAQAGGTTPNNFTTPVTYIVTAANGTTATYTVTVTLASISAKAITAFSFVGYAGYAGVIDEAAKTIAVTVPTGTNVAALIPTFTTTGTSVKVGALAQVSGTTPNNFTAPVAYIVTAGDTTTTTYIVTVTVAQVSAKAIIAFSFVGFPGAAGIINEAAKTIAVTVPTGTNVTALIATFTTTGTSVKVGAVVQVSGTTPNNFTGPVAYIVTAGDTTTATYTVTVTMASASAKAITAYSFAGFIHSAGNINEPTKTIAVSVPPGSLLNPLVAIYTSTGINEKVAGVLQTSGATSNTYTNGVALPYVVTASDLTTATYNVTVTEGAGPVPVPLGMAENFVILTQAGITDVPVPTSTITGNVGTSPITGAQITGTGWCTPAVAGLVYTVDATGPACRTIDAALLTTAINNMGTAYTNAFTRPAGAGAFLNPGAGILGVGTILPPGLYTFTGGSANVSITTNLTLTGGPNDVWIFQIPGTLGVNPAVQVTLSGGALARNVFWQVAGAVTLNTTSHFEGVILAQTNIAMNTGATINGRLMAQTAVTLASNTVTQPAP
jgi:Ice-binding-like